MNLMLGQNTWAVIEGVPSEITVRSMALNRDNEVIVNNEVKAALCGSKQWIMAQYRLGKKFNLIC